MLVEMLAAVILLGVTTYAVLGGADFGGGFWDLFATGPRAEEQREAIAHAMGPVWEANHVWLIFVIILVFTAFPEAFAVLSIALFVPWHLVLLGIVLRGAAFVFRSYGPPVGRAGRIWGRIFGVASLVTPLILGMSVGAVSSGNLRVDDEGHVVASALLAWLTPEAWATGLIAVAVAAYLAAVYLTLETDGALREDFRRRAIGAWALFTLLALAALPVLWMFSPHLWDEFLRPESVVLFAAESIAGVVALGALLWRRLHLARAAAIAQVVILIFGWALVMQFPYVIYPDFPLAEAAASAPILQFTLWTVAIGSLVLIPSLVLLFRVFKGKRAGVRAS